MKKFNYIGSLLVLFSLSISCSDYKIVDLSNKIELPTIMCNNNDIDFFIQGIILENADESKLSFELFGIQLLGVKIEGLPSFSFSIEVKNNSDTTFCLNFGRYQSDIVGIRKTIQDTVFLTGCFEEEVFINKKESCIVEVGVNWLSFSSFNESDDYIEFGDNTDRMLSFIRDMEFYYIPVRKDTLKNNNYCIGMSPKTKLTSCNPRWPF